MVRKKSAFRKKRPEEERRSLMLSSLESYPNAVVSGSVVTRGEQIENAFDMVIFLYVETHIRLKRLDLTQQQWTLV